MSTVGAIAEVIAVSLKLIQSYIDDPKRRARAIADYINGLRGLRDKLGQADAEELDQILLTIIDSKP